MITTKQTEQIIAALLTIAFYQTKCGTNVDEVTDIYLSILKNIKE